MLATCDLLPAVAWLALPASYAASSVAVFRISVAEHVKHAPYLYSLLQASEVVRARKYHREADHYRFLIARAALRMLLSKYTGQPPADIDFALGANKKPVLQDTPGLHYNTSHSNNWILLAIGRVEVGIDVEQVDAGFPFQDIVLHSFSPREQAFIDRSPSSRQAFFQLWTRKEALVKAIAQGIDADFDSIPALDGAHDVAGLGGEAAAWAISSFEAAPGYAAAIARPAAIPDSSLCFYEAGAGLFGPPAGN